MAELMAVVAIVGILAAIATVSVKKYIASSKTSEAVHMIASIKIAEETYKDETFGYLSVSTNATDFYPNNNKPGQQKMNFPGTAGNVDGWQKLGVSSDAPVLFVYALTAGPAGSTPTATGTGITVGNWPTTAATKPWYVVKAKADLAGNGTDTVFISGSFVGELFAANN